MLKTCIFQRYKKLQSFKVTLQQKSRQSLPHFSFLAASKGYQKASDCAKIIVPSSKKQQKFQACKSVNPEWSYDNFSKNGNVGPGVDSFFSYANCSKWSGVAAYIPENKKVPQRHEFSRDVKKPGGNPQPKKVLVLWIWKHEILL